MSLSGSGSLLNLLKYYFYNLIFLNFLHPCVFNALHPTQISDCAVNGSLWTIKFELIFYLSLPVIVFVVRKINPKICACLLALMLTFSSVTNSIYLVIFICFLSGVLLYHSKAVYLLSTIPLYVSPFVRQIALIIAVFACAYLIVPLFLSCLLFFVISFFPTHGKGVSIRVNTFGDLSYGIYLVHYPIIQILRLLRFVEHIPQPLLAPVVFALSFCVAVPLYNFIEKPFLLSSSHYKTSL